MALKGLFLLPEEIAEIALFHFVNGVWLKLVPETVIFQFKGRRFRPLAKMTHWPT